ncbi:hypothetical protein AAC387_Pa05g0728 [Persea americana]
MEVGLSLYSTVSLPLSSNSKTTTLQDAFLKPHSDSTKTHQKRKLLKVEAKGKRGMQARRFQRAPPLLPFPKSKMMATQNSSSSSALTMLSPLSLYIYTGAELV